MVHFNELRITPDGKNLIIDVRIPHDEYHENVYLEDVIIDNQDTYTSTGPSSSPKYYYKVIGNTKHLRLVLDKLDNINLNDLMFIYVRTKGTYAPNTPCKLDEVTTMHTVINLYPFYQQAMNYIKELSRTCNVPQNFTDYVLKLHAFKLAVKTGNYQDAIDYYNLFFKGKNKQTIKKGGCGCGYN